MSVEDDLFFKKNLNLPTQTLPWNAVAWNHPGTLCSVHCLAHPKVFNWLINKMSSRKLKSGLWFLNQYTYVTSWCKKTALCKEVELLVEMTNFSRPQIGIWGWTWQNWWSNFEAFLKHSRWLTGRRGDWWGWESSGWECVQIGRNLKHGYWNGMI